LATMAELYAATIMAYFSVSGSPNFVS